MSTMTPSASLQIPTRRSSVSGYPIAPGTTVEFPRGIPGFESVTTCNFVASDMMRPFMFMEALERDDISFVCVDPYLLDPSFHPRLRAEVLRRLQITHPEEVIFLAIVTVGESVDKTTANLLCPLVINGRTWQGEQVVLDNGDHPMQLPLATCMAAVSAAA